MRHHTENKLARFEEWSHMSIGLRYRAGAMGIPFMPSRTMLGSDVGKRVGDEIKEMQCPFTGEKIVLRGYEAGDVHWASKGSTGLTVLMSTVFTKKFSATTGEIAIAGQT
jgi:acyl CoA:acetate/3-ketoacid CoA transferase alpha subunit